METTGEPKVSNCFQTWEQDTLKLNGNREVLGIIKIGGRDTYRGAVIYTGGSCDAETSKTNRSLLNALLNLSNIKEVKY